MNNNQFSFHKDTTSKLIDGKSNNISPIVSSFTVLLLAFLQPTQSLAINNICKERINCPQVEWKFNSSQRIAIANESVRLHRRLRDIISLCADEDDMMPIGQDAIKNMKCILVDIKDSLLNGWNIFPNNNGTLSMEYKRNDNISAVISIGYNMISYSLKKDDRIHIIGKEPFSFSAIENLLEKIV